MNQESEKILEVAEPVEENLDLESEETESDGVESEELEFTDTSNQNDVSRESTTEEEAQINQDEQQKKSFSQSKEERTKNAQIRREKEERIRNEAYKKGKFEAFKGKINPYTNTIINDEKDVEVYENMYELSQNGKDPVADYAMYIAEKERQEEEEKRKQEEIQEKASKDIEEFQSKYPQINLTELFEDSMFMDYLEGKTKSLTEIYESFQRMKNSFRTESINQAKATIANSVSTPGSLNGISDDSIDYEKMSTEDFLKEVERIKNGE